MGPILMHTCHGTDCRLSVVFIYEVDHGVNHTKEQYFALDSQQAL
jgi:hypothetical protein